MPVSLSAQTQQLDTTHTLWDFGIKRIGQVCHWCFKLDDSATPTWCFRPLHHGASGHIFAPVNKFVILAKQMLTSITNKHMHPVFRNSVLLQLLQWFALSKQPCSSLLRIDEKKATWETVNRQQLHHSSLWSARYWCCFANGDLLTHPTSIDQKARS